MSGINSERQASANENYCLYERKSHPSPTRKVPSLPMSNRKLDEVMAELSKQLRKKIKKDHFIQISGE